MHNYIVQQRDLDLLRQGEQITYAKVELLNHNMKTIESLEGAVISDSFTCDGDSTTRRTYNCTINVEDNTFMVGKDKKIWIDKYIRVYYGMRHIRSSEIIWYLLGTMSFFDMDYKFSSGESTLSLSCLDMMAEYDGTKGGTLKDQSLKVPAGEDLRLSVIGLLKDAGITDYIVEDIGKEIPYDMEWTAGSNYVQALSDIRDLYDSWEFFFDEYGTFIWRKIPTGYDEPVILDNSILNDLYVDISISDSFREVYNATQVWGKSFKLEQGDRFADASTYSNNIYSIRLEGVTSIDDLDNFTMLAVRICSENNAGASISVNGLEAIPIVNDDDSGIVKGRLAANKDYVFKYRRTLNGKAQKNFYILGQYQAYGYYEENNKNCPYSIPNIGYRILRSLDMQNLYSDDLCYNQAEYETYQTTAKQDSITLTCLIIPFLEPNQKIKFTPYFGETAQYIIKSFSWESSSGTMSINMYRFLEDFSYVKNQKIKAKGR